jgi:hypothetical protein
MCFKFNFSLLKILLQTISLWVVANIGYYTLFPLLGVDLSYNESPIIFAVYFAVWFALGLYIFWDLFVTFLSFERYVWFYVYVGIGLVGFCSVSFYILSLLPVALGEHIAPYTDIVFATPWYFLPKSTEILLQQTIVIALVIGLHNQFQSFARTVLGYLAFFGGVHVLTYFFGTDPTPHAGVMAVAAVISTAFFPYLILKVRSGFVYCFIIHLTFYIGLSIYLHTLPSPPFV